MGKIRDQTILRVIQKSYEAFPYLDPEVSLVRREGSYEKLHVYNMYVI